MKHKGVVGTRIVVEVGRFVVICVDASVCLCMHIYAYVYVCSYISSCRFTAQDLAATVRAIMRTQ